MYFNKLILTNFKNYESEVFGFHQKFNVITGLNGMGKTNLLDALYYLCLCKSYFQRQDRFVANHESSFLRLEAVVNSKDSIVAKVVPGTKKVFELNRAPYNRLSEHLGFLPVIFVTPSDIDNLLAGSEQRRILIDQCICQYDRSYVQALLLYNRSLKQRNAYLKQALETRTWDQGILDAWESNLCKSSSHIYDTRKKCLAALNPIFQAVYAQISGKKEAVNCDYHSNLAEYPLEILLDKHREQDRNTGRTNAGIHKDDLIMHMNGKEIKRFASQGQLKSYVLALKLSMYHLLSTQKGQRAILLLDDIFDKLDNQRVKNLLTELSNDTFGQIFITDTSKDRVATILKEINQNFSMHIINSGKRLKDEQE